MFAKGGHFDANWVVAKNWAGINHAKPRFFEGIRAASNRSPMRRGLKRPIPPRAAIKANSFKPIPDEEGTETLSLYVAVTGGP